MTPATPSTPTPSASAPSAPAAPASTPWASPSAPVFLPDVPSDTLARVCLELAAELWVVKRRLAAVERQLVDAEVITDCDEIEAEPMTSAERQQRQRFIERVLGAVLTAGRQPAHPPSEP